MTLVTTNLTDSSGTALELDAWEFIETQTASGDATIEVINLTSDYFLYKFIWYGLVPSVDDRELRLRVSLDNGVTFDSAGNYRWGAHFVGMEVTPAHVRHGDNIDTEIHINGTAGSGGLTNETNDLEITCFNPSITEFTRFKWESIMFDHVSDIWFHCIGAGGRMQPGPGNAVQFYYETGNIAQGTLWVYGIRG